MPTVTIGALLRAGSAVLSAAAVEAPEHDARELLAHVLDMGLNEPLLHLQQPVTAEMALAYQHLLALRARHTPLQYVTRSTWFGHLKLRIDDRALIPRPETEQLAAAVIERLRPLAPGPEDYLVDVGCGSGAIGLSLAAALPRVQVVMTDISLAALDLTAENTALQQMAERVVLLQGEYLEPIWQGGLAHGVVAVVSNPPYVRPDEFPLLSPEVQAEPRAALVAAEADGLTAYRALAEQAAHLPRLRLLAFEVGFGQAPAVAELVCGLGEVETLNDYADIARMVIVHVRR